MTDAADRFAYPPESHVLRDLPFDLEAVSDRRSRARLAVGPSVTVAGSVAPGPLMTVIDVLAGSLVGRVLAPDWMATAELSLHLATPEADRAPLDTVRIDAVVVREGRTTVVVDVAVGDDERPEVTIGEAMLTFVRLPRRDSNLDLSAAPVTFGERHAFDRLDPAPAPPFAEAIGAARTTAPGRLELAITPHVRNSFGATNGGIVASLAQLAAVDAASARWGTGARTTDVVAHYLSQGKVGPLATTAREIRSGDDEALLRVEVCDTGQDRDGGPAVVLVAHVRCIPEPEATSNEG
jgi:acyl-coenzyme A thioesterase PaaI-like protein